MFSSITVASGKLDLKLLAASGSLSSPRTISNPAARNPSLVPPQPQKKSKTLIGLLKSGVGRDTASLVTFSVSLLNGDPVMFPLANFAGAPVVLKLLA